MTVHESNSSSYDFRQIDRLNRKNTEITFTEAMRDDSSASIPKDIVAQYLIDRELRNEEAQRELEQKQELLQDKIAELGEMLKERTASKREIKDLRESAESLLEQLSDHTQPSGCNLNYF